MKKVKYSLAKFNKDSVLLANQIKKLFEPEIIVMLVRGGVSVGGWITQYFDTKSIYTSSCVPEGGVSGKVLFVSDLCRSSETIKKVINSTLSNSKVVDYRLACIHYYPNESDFVPDFYVHDVSSSIWIVYPWEI